MGMTDQYLHEIYKKEFPNPKRGKIALLGSTDNELSRGDLYDLALGNWDINSDWTLPKKYNAIISTRCPYFAKDPLLFIQKCHENLKKNGEIFLDWGLGDHWRFPRYKVGWIKEGEHEWAYHEDNKLWSTVWDDSFLEDKEFQKFEDRVRELGHIKGYVKDTIFQEVPNVLRLEEIEKYFTVTYKIKSFWIYESDLGPRPQLYIFIKGVKK